jgi:hypothetical protein
MVSLDFYALVGNMRGIIKIKHRVETQENFMDNFDMSQEKYLS